MGSNLVFIQMQPDLAFQRYAFNYNFTQIKILK
jgi:hypothetical protein